MLITDMPASEDFSQSEWYKLRGCLSELYHALSPNYCVWSDNTDHAYITRYLIERSIALNADYLKGRLIDVGCGAMPYRDYYRNAISVVGCDVDKSRGAASVVCPAHQVPSESNSFDTVVCTEVLEHVPDPIAVWREFYRILAPGGAVVLATPSYWPAHEIPHDYYRYTEHGLRYLAQSAGFCVAQVVPRGGMWAFYGQVGMHVVGHYMRARSIRRLWNSFFLWADRARLNPSITLGWTIVAFKPKT